VPNEIGLAIIHMMHTKHAEIAQRQINFAAREVNGEENMHVRVIKYE